MRNLIRIIGLLAKSAGYQKMPAVTHISADGGKAFEVLVSCIMSLRTKDETTYPTAEKLFRKARTPKQIASMPLQELKKMIRPVNYYKTKAERIKKIAQTILKKHKGKVPSDFDELLKFKGVGRKTANIVMVYGFGKDGIAVDTHVHRISNRLGWVKAKDPHKTEFALRKLIPKKYWLIINEILVRHGQNICNPISPWCSKCPVEKYCPKVGVEKSR
jgi:endonuclease-3